MLNFRYEALAENPEFAKAKFGMTDYIPQITLWASSNYYWVFFHKNGQAAAFYPTPDAKELEQAIMEWLENADTVLPSLPKQRSHEIIRIKNREEFDNFFANNEYGVVLSCKQQCGENGEG